MKKIIRNIEAVIADRLTRTDIVIEDGVFGYEGGKAEEIDGSNLLAVPGFIDTHIHGFAGFGTEDARTESILNMSRNLIKYGITSFFPTIYTDTLERMEKDIIAIRDAMGKEEGAEIKGIHIEGPFISPKRIGAQNPEGQRNPDKALFKHFTSLAPKLIEFGIILLLNY